jgi:pimeloyl-ACP methyl ester carboxylesterase
MSEYFWDERGTRYRLVKSVSGTSFNWLFLPGGPGGDSSYYLPLIEALNFSGNYWLIDLPGNGSNTRYTDVAQYDYQLWHECFLPAITRFNHPILVGHSFGALFPLVFPQLENILSGLILVGGIVAPLSEAAAQMATDRQLPSLLEPMQNFVTNPTQETFDVALRACCPYYFPQSSLAIGMERLAQLAFNYRAALWGQIYLSQLDYAKLWIPQKVKTLAFSGGEDCITPFILLEQDERLKRNNIQLHRIKDAGHLPWLEKMDEVKNILQQYYHQLDHH